MFFFDDYKSRKILLSYLNFIYKIKVFLSFKRRKYVQKDCLCKLHRIR